MLIEELASICAGRWHGQPPAGQRVRLCTDTRRLRTGEVFLALRGAHFDGHRFLADARQRACALIGEKGGKNAAGGTPYLEVEDSLRALGDIAHAQRMRRQATTLIAITGSYGKTTVRSMLAHAFSRLGLRVHATCENHNNLIGVPQTLLSIPAQCEIALVECGISERGEMARLAAMVAADAVVFTGLGIAHGAGLGTLADIAREKYRLAEGMRGPGPIFAGRGVAERLPDDPRIIGQKASVRARLRGQECLLEWQGGHARIRLPLPARHWAENLGLCATVLLHIMPRHGREPGLARIAEALREWRPVEQRLRTHATNTGLRLLDDCYNANPASMQAALDTLARMPGRRVAILGDMAELGSEADALHAALHVEAEVLLLAGRHMRALAKPHPMAAWFPDSEQLLRAYTHHWRPRAGDVVLLKASRGMHFERIVAHLRALDGEHGRASSDAV